MILLVLGAVIGDVEEELVAAMKLRARAAEPLTKCRSRGGVHDEARKDRADLCLRRPKPMFQARALEEPEVARRRPLANRQIRRRIVPVAREDRDVIRGPPGRGERSAPAAVDDHHPEPAVSRRCDGAAQRDDRQRACERGDEERARHRL